MAEPAPRPLVELDKNGSPAILSYNVPEPTSYSGKNYIELSQLAQEAFITVISAGDPSLASLAPDTRSAESIGTELLHPALRIASTSDGQDPDMPVVVASTEGITERLARLTRGEARALVAQGFEPVLVRGSGGLLDLRFFEGPKNPGSSVIVPEHSEVDLRMQPINGGGEPPEPKFLSLFINSPADGGDVSGPAAGLSISVAGAWEIEGGRGRPSITLSVDGVDSGTADVSASGTSGTWQASTSLTSSGDHTLRVRGTVTLSPQKKLNAAATVHLNVQLDPSNTNDPPALPSVVVTEPRDKTVIVAPTGIPAVTIKGSADSNVQNQSVVVEALDAKTGARSSVTLQSGRGNWALELQLEGMGSHAVTIIARNDKAASAPLTLNLVVSSEQPVRRLVTRLLIVETLTLSSFLGAYGAGRVLRTFSLLPGERTTISVKTFTQSEESRKQAASILDSTASEASSEFDDSISREQTNKDAESEASNYKIGAEASATWGWGSAKVNAEFSGSANSAREEAVKNVKTATQKHASKASSNRSVTVNTDYEVKTVEKTEEATTREISNINVSRTLNFTFRQLNQEHVVLISLSNARLAYYAQDIILGSDGNPQRDADGKIKLRHTYREVSLPEMQSLLDATVVSRWHDKVRDAVVRVLTGIPDYNDTLQVVVESASPKDENGDPVAGAEYLRFPRNLTTTWKDPTSDLTFTVPGIVLSWDKITMRTDGVIVDSVLGQGDALDVYSHGLQDQSVRERSLANAQLKAQIDRERLAQQIVANKDVEQAAIFEKLFPPPPAPINEE